MSAMNNCLYCERTFNTTRGLNIHITTDHRDEEIYIFLNNYTKIA